jgi:hypothetical protein
MKSDAWPALQWKKGRPGVLRPQAGAETPACGTIHPMISEKQAFR